jgi:uncharacterized protein (TIGR02001 family)
MKKLVHALVLTGLVGLPTLAMAEEAESPHSLSANVTLTSNYIFRGISQTGGDPAIQGGFDYGHSSGFYLGTWASNVGWIEDFQGYDSGNVEIDLYGGYRGSIGSTDFTFDVGAIQYWYPGDKPSYVTDADTTEIYGGVGWKWFGAKYSYYLSDEVFGFGDADGSYYLGLTGSLPIGETGLTAAASWGTFKFKNNGNQDYDDWSISATYDMGKLSKVTEGVTVGLKYTDTNADRAYWTDANGEDLSKGTATFWVAKAF